MQKTAFISISLSHRPDMDEALNCICHVLRENEIEPLIFVDKTIYSAQQEKEMMAAARADIETCDFLIAELTHKAIGVGVEVGYAVGIGKPVIYLRHEIATHSLTVSGMATYQVIYSTCVDLQQKLAASIQSLM